MREKLIELIRKADKEDYESRTQDEHYAFMADLLIANDVVPVVRCKDCKRWKYDARKLCGFCDALICYRPDYFWCLYGERKDND